MTASTLYEAVEPQILCKQLLGSITSEIIGDGKRTEAIQLTVFVLKSFAQDEEMQNYKEGGGEGGEDEEGDGDVIMPGADDDSSEEEEDDDAEEAARIREGFIVDEEEEDEDADGFGSLNAATPTKARLGRQRTISHISDGEGEGEEWTIESSPDVLLLGGPETQEWLSSGEDGDGPPATSSPGDVEEDHELGGFGDTDSKSDINSTWESPVRAGSRRGRVLVGNTPTKPR